MDDLVRDRLGELAERMNELVARISRLETDNTEAKHALIVLLTRLKRLEARHRPPALLKRKRA